MKRHIHSTPVRRACHDGFNQGPLRPARYDRPRGAPDTDGYIPLKEIASRQNISEKYLESIIKSLVKSNMLVGLRGKGGGYRLTREPDQYTIGEVLRLTEGSLAPVACLEANAESCPRMFDCRTISLWRGLDEVVNEYLDGITVADLIAPYQSGDNYVI